MADDDSDEEDLWADLDDDNTTTLNVSANLLADAGKTAVEPVHKGDADEGKILWVAPVVPGLGNSDKVNTKEKHWYRDEHFKNVPDKNKPPPTMPAAAPPTPTGGMAYPASTSVGASVGTAAGAPAAGNGAAAARQIGGDLPKAASSLALSSLPQATADGMPRATSMTDISSLPAFAANTGSLFTFGADGRIQW